MRAALERGSGGSISELRSEYQKKASTKEFFQHRLYAENIRCVLIREVASGVKGAFKGQGVAGMTGWEEPCHIPLCRSQ